MYSEVIADPLTFRAYVDGYFAKYPQAFPGEFSQGYKLHDTYESKKIHHLTILRIMLKNGEVYPISPSSVLPYLTGHTDQVAKGLLLRHWAVLYEVIAALFGRNPLYWERVEAGLGRISLVGSLVKTLPIPQHLAADEKITFWNGEEAAISLLAKISKKTYRWITSVTYKLL